MKNIPLKTLSKIGGQVFFKVLAVGLGIFTIRWFNNTDYLPKVMADEYQKILAVNAILQGFLSLGLANIIQKVFTKTDDIQNQSDTLYTINLVRVGTYLTGLALVCLIFLIGSNFETIGQYIGITNFWFFISLFSIQFFLFADLNFRSVADTTGRSWLYSLTDFLTKIIYVSLLYILINLPALSDNPVLVITIAGFIANLGILLIDNNIYSRPLPKPKLSLDILKKNWRSMFYLGIVGAYIGLFNKFDDIMIQGQEEGILRGYGAAYQIFEVIMTVPVITMPVLASHIVKKNQNKNKFILLGIPAGIGLALISIIGAQILLWITKSAQNYPTSSQVMPILLWGLIPTFCNNLIHFFNIFNDHEKWETYSTLFIGALVIILYFFLIPIYGVVAAAWITVFGVYVEFLAKYLIFLTLSKKK